MNKERDSGARWYIAHLALYVRAIAKWIALAAVIGLLCGLIGSVFHIGVERATEYRLSHGWVIYTLPLAALLAVGIYRVLRVEGHSTDTILRQIQTGEGLKIALLPAIFLATVLTHLAGGSAGREGAALQMGGTIGYGVGRAFRLDDRDRRTATMVGMAAFFSALFGTPLAAAVFAMGVVSVGAIYHAAFIPCFTAALTAYGMSRLMGVAPTRFHVTAPALDAVMLLRVAALAVGCAVLSVLFCALLHRTEHLAKRYLKDPWLRALLGGAALLGLTKLVGTADYNGAGMGVIAAAVEQGRAASGAFLWKMVFTAITLSVGFKGGEVVPCFFIGSTFGALIGPLLGIPAGFAAAVGLVGVFCASVNCPLASIFLAVELFGAEGLLYYALACGLSYTLSGYSGLYSSQRILYDKLKATYIDVHTNAHHEGRQTQGE